MSEFTPKYAGSNATSVGVVVEKHGKPTIIRVPAALAAAAPDLLEACRKALTCASIDSNVAALIRAAIKKATQ